MSDKEAVSSVEVELSKAAGMSSPSSRDSKSMEQYKTALVQSIDKLPDDDFDLLSEEAQQWVEVAIEAILNEESLPEFDSYADVGESVEEADDSEDSAEEGLDEDGGDEDGGSQEGGDADNDSEEEPSALDEANEKQAKDAAKTVARSDMPEKPKASKSKSGPKPMSPQVSEKKKSAYVEKSRKFFQDRELPSAPKYKGAGYRAKEFYLAQGIEEDDVVVCNHLKKEGRRMSPSTLQSIKYEFKQAIVLLNEYGLLDKKRWEKLYQSGNIEEFKNGD